ncbi:hypothetical protein BO225_07505 [Dubosiella newyorkensis]|uniref:Uncharacterized protein n=1 Tax=Dubosiella newyorkensis TaxID=1862672 RepID=A0A1U7NLW1_9FIRM|nr:hypothetical protein BO225_07505 [Dubosiella newyorkensis]
MKNFRQIFLWDFIIFPQFLNISSIKAIFPIFFLICLSINGHILFLEFRKKTIPFLFNKFYHEYNKERRKQVL